MNKVEITEIVQKIGKGDVASFRKLYDTFYPTLFVFAKSFVDYEDAKDVMAEVFSKVWQNSNLFAGIENIPSYLKMIVRNACINVLRYEKYVQTNQKQMFLLAEHEVDNTYEISQLKAEAYKKIADEVNKLAPQERRVFQLSYLDGLKNAQIAEMLGLSEQTVRNTKSRALSKLRVALAKKPYFLLLLIFLEL